MKIWNAYGSEHSSNLVMIGKFKQISDAEEVNNFISLLTNQVRKDVDAGFIISGKFTERFSDEMLELLRKLKFNSITPIELEQFDYDVSTKLAKDNIILETNEVDVSAYLKLFIDNGARVEIYSAHDYPDTEQGR